MHKKSLPTPRWFVYVDNVGLIGIDRALVDEVMGEVIVALERRGLVCHERKPACDFIETLGVQLDGRLHQCRLTPKRSYRIRCLLEWILKQNMPHVKEN